MLAGLVPVPAIFGQLGITTQSVPYGSVGTAYSVAITSTASAAATWAITTGNLPPGVLLTTAKGSSATISGTPTNGGVFSFSITVTDSLFNNASATKAFSIGILAITTKSPLPDALVGSAYSATFAAANTPGPYTWSVVVAGTLPPGPSLSPQGVLSGTPTAASSYSFTISAVDSAAQAHATALFSITVNAPTGPLLRVSPLSLSFSGLLGGSSPTSQAISIMSPGGGAVNFAATVDSGVPGSGPPGWITITPVNDAAPARVTVTVNAGRLVTGMVSAVIHITAPNNPSQASIDVHVTFNVSSAPPQLGAFPNAVRFGAVVDNPFPQSGFVFVTNDGGGGTIKVAAHVLGSSSWITGVTPGQGIAGPDQPLVIRVDVNTQGLQVGLYHDILQLTSTTGNKSIPVTVFVSEAGATLELGSRGLHFQLRQGHGSTLPQSISVLDLGDPSSVVNWKAELLSGFDFLRVVTPTGVATPTKPGILTLAPTSGAANLPAGSHYALLRVSDPQALVSPRYHTVVFDVADANAPALPDFSPGGMLFTTSSPPQDVLVYTSSLSRVSFQAAPHTEDGLAWLVATPSSSTVSTAAPGKISVSVTPAGLTAGIHYGEVSVAMSGFVFHVSVTLIVPPGTIFGVPQSTAGGPVRAAGTTCVPSALALTATGLVNNFSVPAGWPASLIAQLNDDCGNPITDGNVVATFSNGDPPLTLRGDHNTNVHSASWQPGAVFPEMTITLRASKGSLSPAIRQFIGTVNQNNEPAPALISGGFL